LITSVLRVEGYPFAQALRDNNDGGTGDDDRHGVGCLLLVSYRVRRTSRTCCCRVARQGPPAPNENRKHAGRNLSRPRGTIGGIQQRDPRRGGTVGGSSSRSSTTERLPCRRVCGTTALTKSFRGIRSSITLDRQGRCPVHKGARHTPGLGPHHRRELHRSPIGAALLPRRPTYAAPGR
jgi:hypothetical protein